MAFTSPTDDIILQEGTFAFDYDAVGAITKGQGVVATSTLGVKVPANVDNTPASGCLGVAAYTIATGNPIEIYGPGNIVRIIVSGTCNPGDTLFCLGPDGKFASNVTFNAQDAGYTNQALVSGGVHAIALETGTNASTVRVMLK